MKLDGFNQLSDHATLHYSLASTGSRWTLSQKARTESIRIKPTLQANSSLALGAAVHQGLGIARLPTFVVGQELAQQRLVQVLLDWELGTLGIYALTTARDYLPRKTRAFIEFFRQQLGTAPHWENGLTLSG